MTSEVTPGAIRGAEFRTALRGLDRAEVESFLAAVASRVEALEEEATALKARVADLPGRDLESEFEAVGREVAAILEAARDAAEALRERASVDAARWRSEAMEEADTSRKEAAADAEALRRDAWVVGTEMLEQAREDSEGMRAQAERDVLTTMGEAEREAHRLTSGARREAEDLVRNASMDAEKITTDATTRRDDIIDAANRQAAAAQERTRALEQRRDELLEELENVRSTLTRLEGSLEEKRETMDLSTEPATVRVVHPPEDAAEQWQLGETVRVVSPTSEEAPPPDPALAEEVSEEVAAMKKPEPEPEPAPEATEPAPAAPEPVAEQPEPQPQPNPDPSDDVDALFASLRGANGSPVTTAEEPPAEAVKGDQSEEPAPEPVPEPDPEPTIDWESERESLLIPITNRALRGVKKAMTEVQNVALDSLRTDESWRPDAKEIGSMVHAELVAVWTESFSAGHSTAERKTGEKLKRPKTPAAKGEKAFAKDLTAAVSDALEGAGDGPRERQSAASKVFRVWRSDEAEQRIRAMAVDGYEAGIEKSMKAAAPA